MKTKKGSPTQASIQMQGGKGNTKGAIKRAPNKMGGSGTGSTGKRKRY